VWKKGKETHPGSNLLGTPITGILTEEEGEITYMKRGGSPPEGKKEGERGPERLPIYTVD